MANAERHAELGPTGHWLQEEGAVCRYFEELLSSSAATDPRRTYARDHYGSQVGWYGSWGMYLCHCWGVRPPAVVQIRSMAYPTSRFHSRTVPS